MNLLRIACALTAVFWLASCNSYSYSDIPKLRKGAESGDATAQVALGAVYLYGYNGTPKDDVEALKWIRKAAEQGQPLAEFDMGGFYREGRGGLTKNDAEAVRWFRKSAEHGNQFAQGNLAQAYMQGFGGLPQDYVQAYMWNELASRPRDMMSVVNGHDSAPDLRRADLERQMTPQQIDEAKRMASER